ncbi:hypothetical protein [Moraxella marmotae]|uniref:hypothetical protein n=1 Tax=Moraxella marmotae TaxID=3344520 RepID=UPI0035F239C1
MTNNARDAILKLAKTDNEPNDTQQTLQDTNQVFAELKKSAFPLQLMTDELKKSAFPLQLMTDELKKTILPLQSITQNMESFNSLAQLNQIRIDELITPSKQIQAAIDNLTKPSRTAQTAIDNLMRSVMLDANYRSRPKRTPIIIEHEPTTRPLPPVAHTRKDSSNKQLKRRIKQLERDKKDLTAQNKQLLSINQTLTDAVAKSSISETIQVINNNQAEIQRLTLENAQHQQAIREQSQQINELQAKNEQQEQRISELQADNEWLHTNSSLGDYTAAAEFTITQQVINRFWLNHRPNDKHPTKEQVKNWIKQRYPKLSDKATERIDSVARPDYAKAGGRF